MSRSAHIPRGDSAAAQFVSAHRREFARLPPPEETWQMRHVTPEVTESHVYQLINYGLVKSDGWADEYRREWRTCKPLWVLLERHGVVDENGRLVGCGDDGPLPCGSRAFRNLGDQLQCKYCDRSYYPWQVEAWDP